MKTKFILIVILTLGFISCARLVDVIQNTDDGLPENEATVEESNQINRTLMEIEKIAARLGHPKNFRRLPVLVASNHPQLGDHDAVCSYIGFGDNGYIAIKPRVFQVDSREGRFDFLFTILLHEIGHCYFGRGHEHAMVHNEKYKVVVQVTDSVGGTQITYDSFPVSVMNESGKNFGDSFAGIPLNFKEYFVAEILGIDRIESIEDLKRFSGVQIIPKSE